MPVCTSPLLLRRLCMDFYMLRSLQLIWVAVIWDSSLGFLWRGISGQCKKTSWQSCRRSCFCFVAGCFICMTYVSNTLQLKLPPTELDERVQANTCKKLFHYSVYVPVNAKVSPRWAVINCMIQRHSLFCGVDDTRQQALWHNSCRHICGWTWSYSGMWSWSFVAWLKEDKENKISDLRHTLMIVLTFCGGVSMWERK